MFTCVFPCLQIGGKPNERKRSASRKRLCNPDLPVVTTLQFSSPSTSVATATHSRACSVHHLLKPWTCDFFMQHERRAPFTAAVLQTRKSSVRAGHVGSGVLTLSTHLDRSKHADRLIYTSASLLTAGMVSLYIYMHVVCMLSDVQVCACSWCGSAVLCWAMGPRTDLTLLVTACCCVVQRDGARLGWWADGFQPQNKHHAL